MAYLGRRGALAPLTSADIPAGIVEGTDIAFLENSSGTQNLGGTYSTERMYLNDSYTLTGDVNVTGHLALGSIADEDIVITQDSTERTITGSGTIDSGNVLQDTHGTDLTGMTGVIGSAVTGSPNLNLTTGTLGSGVTFPAGHLIQVVNHKTTTRGSAAITGANPAYNTGASFTTFNFTPHKASSKLLLSSTTINVQQSVNAGDNPWLCASHGTTLIGSVLSYISYNHWNGAKDATFVSFNHLFNSWGTTQQTIDIRFGCNQTETIKCNAPSSTSYDHVPTGYHEQCFTIMEIAQ
jgi:hypothetical protein